MTAPGRNDDGVHTGADVDAALRAVRPEDLHAEAFEASSARVLARFALRAQPPRRRRRWIGVAGVAAAAVLAAAVGLAWHAVSDRHASERQATDLQAGGRTTGQAQARTPKRPLNERREPASTRASASKHASASSRDSEATQAVDVVSVQVGDAVRAHAAMRRWRSVVARAVRGDAVARARVRGGGDAARDAVLQAAEDRSFSSRASALKMLGLLQPLRRAQEVERVGALLHDAETRVTAVELLVRTTHASGVVVLGEALLADPQAEAAVLPGLIRMARSGRRDAAMAVLLRAAQAGHAGASAAALRVSGPTGVRRVLAQLSARVADHEAVIQSVRTVSGAVRQRLIRAASQGHVTALRLVGEAGLPEAIPALVQAARGRNGVLAVASVESLHKMNVVPSQIALARLLSDVDRGSAVAHRARMALRSGSTAMVAALGRRARTSYRDRAAALRALASMQSRGLDELEQLARQARLWPDVASALTVCSESDAALVLARLGHARPRFDVALRALIARLRMGISGAEAGLISLARDADAASVARALLDVPEAAGALVRLRGDAQVGAEVERALRVDTEAGPRRRAPGRTGVRRRNAI